MTNNTMEKTQKFWDNLTAKWWFMLMIPVIFFMVPPIIQKGMIIDYSKSFQVISVIIANNFTNLLIPYSMYFNGVAIVVFALVFVLKNKFSRLLSIYTAVMMLFFMVTQNSGVSRDYGFGIITSCYILGPLMAGLWLWEAVVNRNVFAFPPKITSWKIAAWVLALFAFWNPINPATALPDFNPVYLLTNASSIMLCTFTPMVYAFCFTFYPQINAATLRVTGLTGAAIGFSQLVIHFGITPNQTWFAGVTHLPITILSLAAVVVSFRVGRDEKQVCRESPAVM